MGEGAGVGDWDGRFAVGRERGCGGAGRRGMAPMEEAGPAQRDIPLTAGSVVVVSGTQTSRSPNAAAAAAGGGGLFGL